VVLLQLVYLDQALPELLPKLITILEPMEVQPRRPMWRDRAIAILDKLGYDGAVGFLMPLEPKHFTRNKLVEARMSRLERASVIATWVSARAPDDADFGFDLGKWIGTGKLVYCLDTSGAVNKNITRYNRTTMACVAANCNYSTPQAMLEAAVRRLTL